MNMVLQEDIGAHENRKHDEVFSASNIFAFSSGIHLLSLNVWLFWSIYATSRLLRMSVARGGKGLLRMSVARGV